jgi:hypothetical protein
MSENIIFLKIISTQQFHDVQFQSFHEVNNILNYAKRISVGSWIHKYFRKVLK